MAGDVLQFGLEELFSKATCPGAMEAYIFPEIASGAIMRGALIALARASCTPGKNSLFRCDKRACPRTSKLLLLLEAFVLKPFCPKIGNYI